MKLNYRLWSEKHTKAIYHGTFFLVTSTDLLQHTIDAHMRV